MRYLLIIIFFFSMVCAFALSKNGDYGLSMAQNLNIRKKPTLNSQVVGKLNKGDKIEILSRGKNFYYISNKIMKDYHFDSSASYGYTWYNIKYKNSEGWVFGKYIAPDISYSDYQIKKMNRVIKYDSLASKNLNYNHKSIKIQGKKHVLWFIVNSSSNEDSDSIVFEEIPVLSSNNGIDKIIDLKLNRNNKLNTIYVLNSYIIFDLHWDCETAPCNGEQLILFDTNDFSKKFSTNYIAHGSEAGDPEIHMQIQFDKSSISIIEYRYETHWSDGEFIKLIVKTAEVDLSDLKKIIITDKREITNKKKAMQIFEEIRNEKKRISFKGEVDEY